jgi:CheY-like chemotaxis protein
MLLKKHDINADTADNGKVAVEMVLEKPSTYQLVLMDNLMPVMVPRAYPSVTSSITFILAILPKLERRRGD